MTGGIVGRTGFRCQDILAHNDKLWGYSYTQRQTVVHFPNSRSRVRKFAKMKAPSPSLWMFRRRTAVTAACNFRKLAEPRGPYGLHRRPAGKADHDDTCG